MQRCNLSQDFAAYLRRGGGKVYFQSDTMLVRINTTQAFPCHACTHTCPHMSHLQKHKQPKTPGQGKRCSPAPDLHCASPQPMSSHMFGQPPKCAVPTKLLLDMEHGLDPWRAVPWGLGMVWAHLNATGKQNKEWVSKDFSSFLMQTCRTFQDQVKMRRSRRFVGFPRSCFREPPGPPQAAF